MAELIVKDINSDWSISFDFSNTATVLTCYDFKSMTVGKLKKEIFNANNLYAIEKQKLIFMGIILNQDDVELRNLISNKERVCFHLIASAEIKTNTSSLSAAHSEEKSLVSSIVVDANSLRAASEWLLKHANNNNKVLKTEHFRHLQSIYELLQEVKVVNSHNAVPRGPSSTQSAGDAALPDAAAAAVVVPAERELEPIVWINVSLMAKLVAVAAFFAYNKNLFHRVDQLLCIAVIMVFFYLAHIGAIYRAFQLFCRYLNLIPAPVPPHHAGQPQPQPQQPPNQPQLPQDRRRERFGGIITELLQHGVTIPTSPGVLNDLFSMLAGALCSLYPQWKPVAVAVALHPAL